MNLLINKEERERAFKTPKKENVIEKQQLSVRYHVEDFALENRPQRFLEAFAAILKHTNYRLVLDHYVRISAKCSRCTSNCQIYLATGDEQDIPCFRSELLLKVYRRHFTISGMLRGRVFGDPGLQNEQIQEMAESFYNCTACKRCSIECPMGIDHAIITHLGRYILSELGITPRALVVSTREQLIGKSGNTSAIPVPALLDTLEFLTEDMEEEKGINIPFPIDQDGAEYLFLPAVSDFLMEAETLMGNAAVFKATGDSWTIGTGYFDGINYGLFYSDHILEEVLHKIEAETKRLNIKTILIGECGHASRSAKYFYPTYCGGKEALPVVNILEYSWKAWKEGRLKIKPNVIKEKVTYHDPCNFARSGWIVDQPRELLKAFCQDYVEMTPSGRDNICCGGGGGTVSIDEIRPYRTTIGGRAKAEQIRATGAKYCVAPCANCKKQLKELMEDNNVDCEIVGLHDLLYQAIIFENVEDEKEIHHSLT
ncbi:MAG: (Fe-S)-binding protein [Calditrichaeota bacterium]|nr:(Fe-S)-binding protein [Calditrichota bacterium]MBT7787613.1 (Fe-S)-binding protein [Calditrichota bacterium]